MLPPWNSLAFLVLPPPRSHSTLESFGISPRNALEFKRPGSGFGLSSSVRRALARSWRPSTCLSNAHP
jgi:hypothetical protein